MKYLLSVLMLCLLGCNSASSATPTSNAVATSTKIHAEGESCWNYLQFISEDELWSEQNQNTPVKVYPPSGSTFTWITALNNLQGSLIIVDWDPNGSRIIAPGGAPEWNLPNSSWISIQQTMDNPVGGTGVNLSLTYCYS